MLTIAASLWPRQLDERWFPVEARLLPSEPGVEVLVLIQRPEKPPAGELILVHGMEGSAEAGYMRSMAQAALEAGFVVHRMNLRNCGGTELLCPGLYHSGQTADLMALLFELDRQRRTPVFLVGFSLGGNIVLKLAGELGESGDRLLAGVCSVSAPIDLAACVRRLGTGFNRLYERRFLGSMRRRIRVKSRVMPGKFPVDALEDILSVYEFDDRITAPLCGFSGADQYYTTQSARRFLDAIRVPALLIQARDDPMIPFRIYEEPALGRRNIELMVTDYGGHLGFISRRKPRFWLDGVVIGWMLKKWNELTGEAVV